MKLGLHYVGFESSGWVETGTSESFGSEKNFMSSLII